MAGTDDTSSMNFAKRRELASRLLDGYVHGPAAATAATTRALAKVAAAQTVVLVEGISDQIAVETLARRRDRDLDAEGVVVLPMGGAHSIARYLALLGPDGAGLRLAGLCDLAEVDVFRRRLTEAGLAGDGLAGDGLAGDGLAGDGPAGDGLAGDGPAGDGLAGDGLAGGRGPREAREDLERLVFYVCVEDLEDELIRAIGVAQVEVLIDSQGDLGSFRSLQRQPQWRGQPARAQLRRFLAAGSRRKLRYARLLVGAIALDRLPHPLDSVLTVALGNGQRC